jgi:hypothetical protein
MLQLSSSDVFYDTRFTGWRPGHFPLKIQNYTRISQFVSDFPNQPISFVLPELPR